MSKFILILLVGIVCSGCSSASPRFVNGNYYMVPDDGCSDIEFLKTGIIDCQDSNGNTDKLLSPMSESDIRAYIQNKNFFRNLSAFIEGVNQGMEESRQGYSTHYPSATYTPRYSTGSNSGTPIYDSSECIGAVVNGRCVGNINPSPGNVLRKKCYGTMINGKCQGAIGY